MLRRKPTAVTITSEDIISFEETRKQQKAQKQLELQQQQQQQWEQREREREQREQSAQENLRQHTPQQYPHPGHPERGGPAVQRSTSETSPLPSTKPGRGAPSGPTAGAGGGAGSAAAASGEIDPSDELKPWPGDKARIVRGREERIRGTGTGAGASGRAGPSRRG